MRKDLYIRKLSKRSIYDKNKKGEKMQEKKINNTRGITLIALVVTIIVLIILAGISINATFGENGIIGRTKEAERMQNIARISEKLELLKGPILIDENSVDLDKYKKKLEEVSEEYKVNYIGMIDSNNAYIVVEEKYKFLLSDKENGDVEIIYQGIAGRLELSEYAGKYRYQETKTFEVIKNESGGKLSVKSSNENIATATINGNTVTIKAGEVSGKARITVTSEKIDKYEENRITYIATVENGEIQITAKKYEGVYDGRAHGITVTTETEGVTITYSSDGKIYSNINPTYTDVGEYTTYYKASKEGYKTVSGALTVKINRANGNLMLTPTSATYGATGTFAVSKNESGGALTVSSSNINAATATISGNTVTVTPKIITVPETVNITVTSAATESHTAATATHVARILGTISYTATKYEGEYDGRAHGITVTTETNGATITYSSDGKTYSSTKPTYTDVGEYITYYKITAEDYKAVSGSLTVKINRANGNLMLIPTSATYGATGTFTVSKNESGGALTVNSSNINAAAATISGNTVTVTPKIITVPETVNITVTSAATESHTAATATHVARILGTISYTATKYEGEYDGRAHGITVTTETNGATITYSSDGKTYSSTKPTYTNIGEYTTYYKITAENYKTVSGSLTVKIDINKSILALEPGDYIKYDSGTNGIITCRVLYPVSSQYGLQIISDKNVKKITLGNIDYAKAVESYNNAIETLNNEAEGYINRDYAYDARCVGSIPAVENGMFTKKDNGASNYVKIQFANSNYINSLDKDTNYEKDLEQLELAGIKVIENAYWLASRHVIYANSSLYEFYVNRMDSNGKLYYYSLCNVYSRGNVTGVSQESGFRPCISIKSDIKIIGGDGKSEESAYIMGK